MKAVFDTNILIDSLVGETRADEEYARYEQVYISQITWMEVLVGAKGDDAALRNYLEGHFQVIPVDMEVAETAVQIRRTYHKLRLPDAIILATARAKGMILVTRNTKDFNPAWDDVRVPYSVS